MFTHIIKLASYSAIIALFSILLSTNSQAQSYTASPYDIQIFISEQDPETKIFRIKAQINSKIASDRNTIKWTLPEGIQTVSGESEITGYYCKINEGINDSCILSSTNSAENNELDTFNFVINVIPYKTTDSNIIFNIQSYIDDAEKSYKVTQVAKIQVNSDLELQPITSNYRQLDEIIQVKQMSTQIMFVVFILFAGLILFRRVYLYINPPVKSSYPNDSKILDAYEKLNKGESLLEKK